MRTLFVMLGAAALIACGGGGSDDSDRTPPEVTISSPPADGTITNEEAASFTITSSEPATVCWTLDGGAPTCSAPGALTFDAVLAVVNPGAHALAVTATDAAGNVASAARHWTVDTVAPTITISAPPADGARTSDVNAAFTLTTNEPARICWTLDAGGASCSGAGVQSFLAQLMNLAEGNHTLSVTATDGAANVATASRSWAVDLTP